MHAKFNSAPYAIVLNMNVSSFFATSYLGDIDTDVLHFMSGINNETANQFFTYFTFTGGISFMLLTIIALYLGGARKEALVFAVVFGLTTAVTLGLKDVLYRPRPYAVAPSQEYDSSFPSIHTTDAFALATTISSYHRRFSVIMFAWAVLVGFSRLYLGVHYLTDVLAGALIGTVISLVVTRLALGKDDDISRVAQEGYGSLSNWRNVLALPLTFVTQLALAVYVIITPRTSSVEQND
ncbi:MAG: phosphatase PAP2 family protein [Halobacteriota archaeon]